MATVSWVPPLILLRYATVDTFSFPFTAKTLPWMCTSYFMDVYEQTVTPFSQLRREAFRASEAERAVLKLRQTMEQTKFAYS